MAPPPDIYHSIAEALVSSVSASSATPISLSDLLANNLQTASTSEETTRVARTLRQVLEVESDTKSSSARDILHSYTLNVLSTVSRNSSAEFAHNAFSTVLSLADDELLLSLLHKTDMCTKVLWTVGKRAHSTSDEAFAVDTPSLLPELFPAAILQHSNVDVLAPEGGVEDETGRLLHLWKFFFGTEAYQNRSQEVLELIVKELCPGLVVVSGLRNVQLARPATKVLGSIVNTCGQFLDDKTAPVIWGAIRMLLEEGALIDTVLALWLRWINSANPALKPTEDTLKQEEYWRLIQSSLATGYSERRKYAIYLLQNSVMTLVPASSTISVPRLFSISPSTASKTTAAWTKYSTLVEITSLSTSQNQVLAALPDIRRLLEPSSPIPPSWMIVLVALAFQSGSSGVQSTMWDFVLALEPRLMRRIFMEPEGMRFVNDILVPYSSSASKYQVAVGNTESCEFGNRLASFFRNILKAIGDAKASAMFGASVLKGLEERADTLFPPARVYVLSGLVAGSEGLRWNEIGALKTLVAISRMRRCAKTKVDLAVAAVLKLLLRTDVQAVGAQEFLGVLADVVFDKTYVLTPEYVDELSAMFSGQETLVAELERSLKDWYAPNVEPVPQNINYRVMIATYILSSLDGLKAPVEMVSKLMDCAAEGIRQLTLLTSNERLFNRVVNYLQGGTHETNFLFNPLIRSLSECSSGQLSTDYVAAIPGYLKTFTSKSHTDITFRIQDGGQFEWFIKNCRIPAAKFLSQFQEADCASSEWFRVATDIQICAEVERISNMLGLPLAAIQGPNINLLTRFLQRFSMPELGRNKHTNVASMDAADKVLASVFRLVSSNITHGMLGSPAQIQSEQLVRVFDHIPKVLRFFEYESIIAVLECLQTFADHGSELVSQYPQLKDRILEVWDLADAPNRADAAKVNRAFIDVVFSAGMLEAALENSGLAETLQAITKNLLHLGVGKRSIRPKMSEALRRAFFKSPTTICSTEWLIPVILELVEMPTGEKDVEYLLEESLGGLFSELMPSEGRDYYREYNGDPELFSRAYMVDMLTRMSPDILEQQKFVELLRNGLLEPWKQNFSGMPVYSPWKKASSLQALLLTERFVSDPQILLKTIGAEILAHEPHPRYRFMLEWIMALYIIRTPSERSQVFHFIDSPAFKSNAKLTGSMLKVGLMVARELEDLTIRKEFFEQLVYTVLAMTCNSKAQLRHQSIAMTIELWEYAQSQGYEELLSNPLFIRIYEAILDSPFYKGHKDEMEAYRTFNPIAHLSLAGIFAGSYLLGGDEVEVLGTRIWSAVTHKIPFDAPGLSLPIIFSETEKPLEVHPKTAGLPSTLAANPEIIDSGLVEYKPAAVAEIESLASPAPLQTKAQTWDISTLLRGNSSPTVLTLSSDTVDDNKPEVILLASLITNPINLGGLSRMSEILGVTSLVISDMSQLTKSDFTSTSVHSEAHLPISCVPVDGIPEYLRSMRSKGYETIGIEQTDRSRVLGSGRWEWPRRCVLLLGTEKKGIPGELLGEVEWCVEIPQSGVTRSMNVQTAAAVVVWEWVRSVRGVEGPAPLAVEES